MSTGAGVLERRPRGAEPDGSHRNFFTATASPSRPHAATKAKDDQSNAGASTNGLKQSWNALTKGFNGNRFPKVVRNEGASSVTTKTSLMNANGRIVAFATADAELAEPINEAMASPSAANAATPTMKVTAAAGIFAHSNVRSYSTTPITSINNTPIAAMTTAEQMKPAM